MSNESQALWYVVHTYSGYENKVADNINRFIENHGFGNVIFETRIPTEIVVDSQEEADEYLESLENNPDKWCNMFTVDECRESGYEAVSSSFEHGLYGRVANPKSILENWLKLYPDDKFIFVRTDENPFACEFILMRKIKKEKE